jgi:muramoyltetrapeptide carboxypeptidase
LEAKIRVIRPSSREQSDLLPSRLAALAARGFEVLYEDLPRDSEWAYVASPAEARARALEAALLEPRTTAVLCARGGYGASDLLPLVDWRRLKEARPKWLVGFSDVSALHSALFTKLGWPGLHAPMPATALWEQNGESRDVEQLLGMLRTLAKGEPVAATLEVEGPPAPIVGRLFGGCFTVLTNLIGTPYLPKTLEGSILFLEDTDEHPGRLMRAFNQWIQAGLLAGVRALVIGHLRNLGEKIPDSAPFVYEQFARRGGVPTFRCNAFGHTSPNFPLMVGSTARIEAGRLTWTYDARPSV